MREDERTEFKRTYNDKVIKSIIAFSNSFGGTVYIGVDDDGTVLGVEDSDETCRSVSNGVADNIRPSINGSISINVEEMESKEIVKVDVSEGTSKPYYLREKGLREGGVFIRSGPSSIPAPESVILKLLREQSTPFESLVSPQQNLTFNYARDVFASNNLEFEHANMISLGMVDNGLYTNLALLISDQCPFDIKLAVYPDENKTSFNDRAEAQGSIFKQFATACEFIDRHNDHMSKINKYRREEMRAYPEEAVREVLINALVHRDYELGGSILVSLFPNRLSVTSLGGLKNGLTLDELMMGVSCRRNEKLASVMYRLRYMETYGTGIPRIMGSYGENPQKPGIEVTTNAFKITLPRFSMDVLNAEESAVMSMFNRFDRIKRMDVEMELSVSRTKAYQILSGMEERNLVEKHGSARSVYYRRK